MDTSRNISLIAAPVICIKDGELEGSQKLLKAAENLVFATPKGIRQYSTIRIIAEIGVIT